MDLCLHRVPCFFLRLSPLARMLPPDLKSFSVTVDPGAVIGPLKDMHAVNNGPSVKKLAKDETRNSIFGEDEVK